MEGAAAEFDYQNPIFNDDDIDLDAILQGIPQDFTLDLDLDQWLSNFPKEPENPPSVEEMEKFLMDDGDKEKARVEYGDNVVEEFFSGILSAASAAAAAAEDKREDEVVVIDGDEREEDEESRKKRRRQMRNRESAMQSRERKKMYVKELEMKSKYLESECRRLDNALRCCMAENFSLHQLLQKDCASAAKQESAVLFMESLLLGSLFWLLSTMFLFLGLSVRRLNSNGPSRLGRDLALEAVVSKAVPNEKSRPDFGDGLVIMRRRYKGSRTRMKSFLLLPMQALST
ncbi:bZIP transcription factor 50 [Asparagus officinalis]|uniref:bZIP transcription factor 50 n=1 Tax=Asparagus officinalis TaxID=4686 RepID=UPI00098E45EB|nr:bZIP transcription factor 50 [Asparagus officinalis]